MGTDKIKKLSVDAEELLEKWPSCDRAQITESLQYVSELWEKFEKDLLEHEKVVYVQIFVCTDVRMCTHKPNGMRVCTHTHRHDA